GLADWHAKRQEKKGIQTSDLNHLSLKQVIFMSLAQAMALIPGTSRSGITISAGLFGGVSKTAAAEFSFLMSIPIIFLAALVKIKELLTVGVGELSFSVLAVGAITAAISGFFAISLLLKVIQTRGFLPFAVYRVIMGIIILVVLV
ncbi:MAG: undecaprenyl-diphosphatase, partial [Candidatus Magasanikbacteria bacterium]|nr:undecaprenyl-diphosphatase [Candidatus Magasanikbacteria bacterium]